MASESASLRSIISKHHGEMFVIICSCVGPIVSISEEESEVQGRKNACVLAGTMLSSDNVITAGGNHIALQTKQIFILFHGSNE